MTSSSTVPARRRRVVAGVLVAFSLLAAGVASAQDGVEEEHGPYFGAGNIPAACAKEMPATLEDGKANPDYWLTNTTTTRCHHMRTDMNGLDTPKVDVLVLVPASPAAERDYRIVRQSIEMWEGGVKKLSRELDLDWLADGVDFTVAVQQIDPAAPADAVHPWVVADPEVVVVATNPVGGLGIGIDPVDFTGLNGGQGLCHGVQDPLDFAAWSALPGFDSHHGKAEGVYTEDCGGAGGNVCFAVNGAIDPTPGEGPLEDFFAIFDLVSHEVGHCLSVGHVGDGAEGSWGGLPTNDIMAYDADPPGVNKCVSTLDVEGFATVMSRYLDVNGDGKVAKDDELLANDQVGEGGSPFQVQRPDEHSYASSTGRPGDCPQPDLGLLPGAAPTDWQPADTAPASPAPAQP
ncbi:MAG: Thrombospondin type 3 repeat [Frankiales bacterium]|jgi:hypothetical protein|nr:Thrombospondin type 3 repeat [Frankiales bacterium]